MTPRIFIAYPGLFNCASKFARKLDSITRRLEALEIVMCADANGLVRAYVEGKRKIISTRIVTALDGAGITHVVVFDEGEEASELVEWTRGQRLPLRRITVAITRAVNIKREPEHHSESNSATYEYIGRGSYWGNPHALFENGETREDVMRKFKYDFEYNKFLNVDVTRVHELAGKRLGCFCKPAPCHGDILAEFLNSYDDGA